jgi:hypothetical protein
LSTILERWSTTAEELTAIVDNNPSLRGVMIGYIGEIKLKEFLMKSKLVDKIYKADDHDRSNKNDLSLNYKGHNFTIEVKSLQTHTVKKVEDEKTKVPLYYGKYQCDASDCREVKLPNGTKVTTTCLLAGEFDIIAVNLFAFRGEWEFGFALNRDLAKSKHKGYTPAQQELLLATLQSVSLPLFPPYEADIFRILDKLVKERGGPAKAGGKVAATSPVASHA